LYKRKIRGFEVRYFVYTLFCVLLSDLVFAIMGVDPSGTGGTRPPQ